MKLDHYLPRYKSFMLTHLDKIFILLLTGGAAVLRLYRLGDWSFWEDEVFVFTSKEDGFSYSFFRRSLTTDLIRQFTLSFGSDEWNARLIPALIGIFTIPVFLFLLKRTFNPRLAWVGSASLSWLLSDHLGSTSRTVVEGSGALSEQRYRAWGESRVTSGKLTSNAGSAGILGAGD